MQRGPKACPYSPGFPRVRTTVLWASMSSEERQRSWFHQVLRGISKGLHERKQMLLAVVFDTVWAVGILVFSFWEILWKLKNETSICVIQWMKTKMTKRCLCFRDNTGVSIPSSVQNKVAWLHFFSLLLFPFLGNHNGVGRKLLFFTFAKWYTKVETFYLPRDVSFLYLTSYIKCYSCLPFHFQ